MIFVIEVGELDHFFDKATYPELSIVCYNLVPTCGICNKNKGTFSHTTNYHPYQNTVPENYLNLSIEICPVSNQLLYTYEVASEYRELIGDLFNKLKLKERYMTQSSSWTNSQNGNHLTKISKDELKSTLLMLKENSINTMYKILYHTLSENVTVFYEYLHLNKNQ